MRVSKSIVKQTVAAMIAVAIIATVLSAGPLGAVGAQDDGVDVPPPSNDGDTPDPYDCGDFENYDQVRAVFLDEFPDDTSDLDRDDDNIPCETEFPDAAETVTPTEDTDTATEDTTTTTAEETEETTATTTEADTEAPSTTETNATPAIASIRIEANPSTVELPAGPSGGSSNLDVTFRDSAGNYVEVIRNVTLTTERGVFLENGDGTITISTVSTVGEEDRLQGNVNLGSAEPGNVTVNAESDGITGSTTVTFVENETEDGDDGTADGGNGKAKMGSDGDDDDAADGGNGKAKEN